MLAIVSVIALVPDWSNLLSIALPGVVLCFRPTGSVMDEIYRTAGDIEENAQNALRRGNQSA
jgi:hypothetical protein